MVPLTTPFFFFFFFFGNYKIRWIQRFFRFQNRSKNEFLAFFSVKYLFLKKIRIKNGAANFLVQNFEKRYFTLRNAQNSFCSDMVRTWQSDYVPQKIRVVVVTNRSKVVTYRFSYTLYGMWMVCTVLYRDSFLELLMLCTE